MEKVQVGLALRWTEEVERNLSRSSSPDQLEGLKSEVMAGRQWLAEIREGGEVVANFVYHMSQTFDGPELAVTGSGGNCPGLDLTFTAMNWLERVEAPRLGAVSIRAYAKRQGMAMKLYRQGYQAVETVMRKHL